MIVVVLSIVGLFQASGLRPAPRVPVRAVTASAPAIKDAHQVPRSPVLLPAQYRETSIRAAHACSYATKGEMAALFPAAWLDSGSPLCPVQTPSKQGETAPRVLSTRIYSQPGLFTPFVRAWLDDGHSYLFSLELGVPFSSINRATVIQTGLPTTARTEETGKSVDVLQSGVRLVPTTGRQDMPAGSPLPIPLIVMDLNGIREMRPDVVGSLGTNLLYDMAWRLDFGKRQVDFILPGNLRGTAREPKMAHRIPLRSDNGLLYVDGAVDGKPTTFLLTSTNDTLLRSESVLATLKPLGSLRHIDTEDGALADSASLRVREIKIGDIAWKRAIVTKLLKSGAGVPNVLGLDLLRRFRITIDLPSKSLYLEPDPAYQEPPPFLMGVGINPGVTKDGHLIVAAIDVPSPAKDAGIQVGDEIVAINGHGIKHVPINKLVAEFLKTAGSSTMSVLHQGAQKPQTYTLKVRKLL